MSYEEHAKAEDPSDYNQRRRLQAIADSQKDAHNTLLQVDAGVEEIDGLPAAQAAFSTVKSYAELLRWPINKHGGDSYYEKSLGTLEVPPPDKLVELVRSRRRGRVTVTEDGIIEQIERVWGQTDTTPARYTVVGLFYSEDVHGDTEALPFTALPPILDGTWEVKVQIRHKNRRDKTFTASAPVPSAVSWKAFNLCNKFLSDTDLDVRINEGRPFNNYSE